MTALGDWEDTVSGQVGARTHPRAEGRLQRVHELLRFADALYPVQRPAEGAPQSEWDAWRRARAVRVFAGSIP